MSRPLFAVTVITAFCVSFMTTSLISGGHSGGGREGFRKQLSFLVTSLVSAGDSSAGHESVSSLAAFRGGGMWQPQYGCQGKLNGILLLSPMWCTELGITYFHDRPSTAPTPWPLVGDAHAGELWIAARP